MLQGNEVLHIQGRLVALVVVVWVSGLFFKWKELIKTLPSINPLGTGYNFQ